MPNTSPQKTADTSAKRLLRISLAAAALGIFDHIYLLNEHYNLLFGIDTGKSLCNINDTFSCAAVSASRYAEFLSVPMALWGVVANSVLLLLLLWYASAEIRKNSAGRRNLLFVSGGIALTSIVMGSISTFLLSRFCPFCMVAYLLSFIGFACVSLAVRRPKAEAALEKAFAFNDFMPVLILSAAGILGAFVANDALTKSYGSRELGPIVHDSVQNWLVNPVLNIQTEDALALGASPDKAKMTIVEFADFRCPHCKHAAPVMRAFSAAHPDVRLEFQAWPLDGECNTSIQQANGASCLLARAVFCAQKVGGNGWKAHEYVFENQENYHNLDAVKTALPLIAEASGSDAAKLVACTDSSEEKASIEKQAKLGTSLNLQGTPTVFVNGRMLNNGQLLQVLLALHKQLTSP